MYSLILAACSSGALYKVRDSASVGADMSAMMEAIAGAEAMRNPTDVKTTEKAEIVSMRRKRVRRRLGLGDAIDKINLGGRITLPLVREARPYQDSSCDVSAAVYC